MSTSAGRVQKTNRTVQREQAQGGKAAGGRAEAVPGRPAGLFGAAGPVLSLGGVMQAKVSIGPVNDRFEQEADASADRVLSGQPVQQVSLLSGGTAQRMTPEEDKVQGKFVQRATPEEEKVQGKFIQRATPEEEKVQGKFVQRATPEEEKVQGKFVQRATPDEEKVQGKFVQRSMEDVAAQALASKGAGSPLSPGTAAPLQRAFDADLSHVRVHDDPSAQQATANLGARAFTHGNDIWLGPGESQSDQRLMAHEVTHVFQQGAATPSQGRQ